MILERTLNARNQTLLSKQKENESLVYTVNYAAEINGYVIASSVWSSEDSGVSLVSSATGTHTGAADQVILTDSAANLPNLIGCTISNTTDSSSATITANTPTTVTGTLQGGTDNDWDASDAYAINFYTEEKAFVLVSGDRGHYFIVNKITTTSGETVERYLDIHIMDNSRYYTSDYGFIAI